MTDQTETPVKSSRARKADAAPSADVIAPPLPPTVVPGTVTQLDNGLVLESF